MQSPRGTQDLLGHQSALFRYIDQTAFDVAQTYGFEEIRTPIFEFSEVFHRTLGETSDVVNKETYTFTDRGGEEITLRPEGTAGIARAFISNGLAQHLPLKYYYCGPMFRYERPQKGRYRQFHQLGVEMLGLETPLADVECIAMAWQFITRLGLAGSVKLQINTLGDQESRKAYRDVLVQYLSQFKDQLSQDSQMRLEKNPLRILDSKDEGDKKIVANAPKASESLTQAAKDFFAKVCAGLDLLKIPYEHNEKLVRGLDYYTHTVFEIVTESLGAQGTVLGGGRYDGLIAMMGGTQTSGIGWASGIERLALMLDLLNQQSTFLTRKTTVAMIPAAEVAESEAIKLTHQLRADGFHVEFLASGNMGKRFKRADKIGASYALVLGDSELAAQSITVKNLKNGEQKLVALKDLKSALV